MAFAKVPFQPFTSTEIDALPSASLAEGDVVYNTTSGALQVWSGSVWVVIGGAGDVAGTSVTITATDGNITLNQTGNVVFDSSTSFVSNGEGTPSFGTTLPGAANSTPTQWLKIVDSEGHNGYIPVFGPSD